MSRISFNKNDKFMKEIIPKANSLSCVKDVPEDDLKELIVYGLSADRGIDVALPKKLYNNKELSKQLRARGLIVRTGVFWSKASKDDNNVVGIGYNIRLHDKQVAIRCIAMAFLTLNKKIDFSK